MEKDNYYINYADLERFLYNLKAKDLNQLKSKIDQSFESIYNIISTEKISTTVETLPTASKETLNSLYVDSTGCYITYNKGTEDSPDYRWMKIGDFEDYTLNKITAEAINEIEYADLF